MKPKWTLTEDNKLRAIYGTIRGKEVAKIIGRTYNACDQRAGLLGLRKRQKNSKRPPAIDAAPVTKWSEHLVDILDDAIKFMETGQDVVCETKHIDGVEMMAFFATKP